MSGVTIFWCSLWNLYIWQVADSEQLNDGRFSMAFTKAKRILFDIKMLNDKRLSPMDIIPLIHAAWLHSFG
jgi:hypothetical protein